MNGQPDGQSGAADVIALKRRALADDVYERLIGALMDQEISPGERIGIDTLARRWGVSPSPIREALARAEGIGLIEREPMRGYFAAPALGIKDIESLVEVRLLLEPRATELAVHQADESVVRALREALDKMKSADTGARYEEHRTFTNADADFHHILAYGSASPFLAASIDRLAAHVHRARFYLYGGVTDSAEAVSEHQQILDAFVVGDPTQAGEAMRRHLNGVKRRVRETILKSQ